MPPGGGPDSNPLGGGPRGDPGGVFSAAVNGDWTEGEARIEASWGSGLPAPKKPRAPDPEAAANVVYNETGGLEDSPGLHDARVAEATVFDHHPNAFLKNES